MMYEEMSNPDYNRSLNRVAGILGTYWSQEIRKTSAYKAHESARRPSSDEDWRLVLENKQGNVTIPTAPSPSGQSRPDFHGSPARGRATSPVPSTSRERGSFRGRGRGRGASAAPGNTQEQALLSALRAFLK